SGPVTFCTGGNVLLTASSGTAYQWKKNGVSISGATLSSYSATDSGQYKCVVAITGCGNIVSNTVTVTAAQPLSSAAITYTGSTTICMGDTLVLNATAGANKTYQWKFGVYDISGATNSFYAATTGGNYKVTVTNTVTGCSKTTVNATVLTISHPSATITPQGPTTFCAGGSVVLSANTGSGLTYKWKKGSNFISGATLANYTATTAGNYK